MELQIAPLITISPAMVQAAIDVVEDSRWHGISYDTVKRMLEAAIDQAGSITMNIVGGGGPG